MRLHYDHITKHYDDRRALIEGLTRAKLQHPDLTFNDIGLGLEEQGMFPAACITLALMTFHNLQGQQTFVVGEHLASMLEHTSMEGIPRSELRLPYGTFYVALPGCKHRIWGGTRTKWHTVEGMYVHLDDDVFTIMAWAAENEQSFGVGDDAQIWVRLDMRRPEAEGEDLETQVYHLLRDRRNERNDPVLDPIALIEGSQDDGIDDEVRAVQTETLTAMYRIAVNLSLYLASPEPETEPDAEDPRLKTLRQKLARAKSAGKRKKLQRQLSNASKATVIRVGRSIEAKAAKQVRQHGSVRGHWVRGHYHHYWTGKGRTVKIRKWLLPYPKGLKDEPPAQRTYTVEDEPENDK